MVGSECPHVVLSWTTVLLCFLHPKKSTFAVTTMDSSFGWAQLWWQTNIFIASSAKYTLICIFVQPLTLSAKAVVTLLANAYSIKQSMHWTVSNGITIIVLGQIFCEMVVFLVYHNISRSAKKMKWSMCSPGATWDYDDCRCGRVPFDIEVVGH
jgi:hypothetical protein